MKGMLCRAVDRVTPGPVGAAAPPPAVLPEYWLKPDNTGWATLPTLRTEREEVQRTVLASRDVR